MNGGLAIFIGVGDPTTTRKALGLVALETEGRETKQM